MMQRKFVQLTEAQTKQWVDMDSEPAYARILRLAFLAKKARTHFEHSITSIVTSLWMVGWVAAGRYLGMPADGVWWAVCGWLAVAVVSSVQRGVAMFKAGRAHSELQRELDRGIKVIEPEPEPAETAKPAESA